MKKYSVREILNKLKWHPNCDFSKVRIICIDRFSGNLEIDADEIDEVGHKFIFLKNGKVIPQHRVIEIRYEGKTVWKKS
jgi:Uncharacterized protein conserved in archaea